MRKLFAGLICFFLLVGGVIAQDTSKIGITENHKWNYQLVNDTNGTFVISTSEGGAIAVGESYTFTITSLDNNGKYQFEYANDKITAAGEGNLAEFTADPGLVYTDWKYWEDNIGETNFFAELHSLYSVNVTNENGVFTASWKVWETEFVIEYYTDTGVLKHSYLKTADGAELEIKNTTGATGEVVPGYTLILGITSLLSIALIVRKRRNIAI